MNKKELDFKLLGQTFAVLAEQVSESGIVITAPEDHKVGADMPIKVEFVSEESEKIGHVSAGNYAILRMVSRPENSFLLRGKRYFIYQCRDILAVFTSQNEYDKRSEGINFKQNTLYVPNKIIQ